MSDAQIAYCESLVDQIIALQIKLNGGEAKFSEQGAHALLCKHNITPQGRTSFREYTTHELQKSISRLGVIQATYKSKWDAVCRKNAEERQQRLDMEADLRNNCVTWPQVKEWMALHAPSRKEVEFYVHAGKLHGESYWRKRVEPVRLYSLKEAEALFLMFAQHQPELEGCFNKLFEPTVELGFDGTLFKPLFTYEQKELDQ